ncbi:MAG: nitroreductase family protein, partial [Candidatus Asgardarchaeia archaeon]
MCWKVAGRCYKPCGDADDSRYFSTNSFSSAEKSYKVKIIYNKSSFCFIGDKMRDLIDIINSRCSIRHFELKPIPNDIIDKIIKAGIRAPTASAAEQWFFVVIEKETVRK